jgi:P27 family predicted phage terminase small subunit
MNDAPSHLDDQARAKWQEIAPTLDTTQPGVADALIAYAVAYSQWIAAQAKVAELGPVVKSAAGFAVISPFVTVAAQAERRMRQWHAVLHLDKRQGRRKADQGTEADGNSLLRLLGGTDGKTTKPKGRQRA